MEITRFFPATDMDLSIPEGRSNVRPFNGPGLLEYADGTLRLLVSVGNRVVIDDVECVVTSVDIHGITTRPLTDAD